MKLICCLLLSLFIVVDLYSQSCKTLESEIFFSSIKLGGQVPGYLTNCSKNTKIIYPYYTDYLFSVDSLNQNCKKKYSDLFKFKSIPFSYSSISTNKKGQIFQVELYYFFEDDHGKDSIVSRPPADFVKLFNKLVSLYGNPTRTEESPDGDSLFIKDLGMHHLVVWECKNINLQLRVNYGSRMKALNIIDIQIRNTQFELVEQAELLQ